MVNRLAKEKSPYLLQHADNPVDWYPWGDEAFRAAQSQDKPIFLSIGYATCHWCHVMKRESFENGEIAQLLNRAFINIKVDREERPEVDSIYMEFAQALMSSAGGWPLNVILTPDLKPFFAVTYLPPKNIKGLMGLPEFVQHIQTLWVSDERQSICKEAEKLVEMFAHTSNATGHELPTQQHLMEAVEKFFNLADPVYGGIRGTPKFPMGYQSEFLMAHAKVKGDSRALFYVELTLEAMHQGGIYDHLGGGFARYAADEEWSIPHFEKMLYDNAILAKTYLEAWKVTKKEKYADVTRETLSYLLRDMAHPEGGFYSGEDADSDGHEGLYYTWTPLEVQEVVPGEDGELLCAFFDITHQGNFEGRNVLHIDLPADEFAAQLNVSLDLFREKLKKGRADLLRQRQSRPKPLRDEKILTSWNGLAIDALARAGSSLKEPRFTEAALQTAEFIRKNLWKEGKLLHRWCGQEAKFDAGLEDYVYLIKGLLSLYEEGCGETYLEWAKLLAAVCERDFKEIDGAFYQTDGREPLILRKCEFYDGAEPSGNGVHTENLLHLYQLTQEESYLHQAEDVLKASKDYIEMFPPGTCYHLKALQRYLDPAATTLTLTGITPEIRALLASHFLPHAAVVLREGSELSCLICRSGACEPPLTKLDAIIQAIEKV